MQACGHTLEATTRNEFDFGLRRPCQPITLHIKTQPFNVWLETKICRALRTRPRLLKISVSLKHKRAVPRAHQTLGVWGGHRVKVIKITPAALIKLQLFIFDDTTATTRLKIEPHLITLFFESRRTAVGFLAYSQVPLSVQEQLFSFRVGD
jgi:hypothetical protein